MEGDDDEVERLPPRARRIGDGDAEEDGDVFDLDLDRLPRVLLGDRLLCRPRGLGPACGSLLLLRRSWRFFDLG